MPGDNIDRSLLAKRNYYWTCACGCMKWNLRCAGRHSQLECDECGAQPCLPVPIVLQYRKADND
jgi:hypothetical protein